MPWKVCNPFNPESTSQTHEDAEEALDDLLTPPEDYLVVKEVIGTEFNLEVDDREGIERLLRRRKNVLVLFQR